MTHHDSSYYPPRATALSPILHRAGACARMLAKTSSRLPEKISFMGLVGGFLAPGLAVYLRSPGSSGKAALAVCAALLLTFIAFLGFPLANAAFTLLLSIHVVGFVAYCGPLLAGWRWPSRLVTGLLLCIATIVVVYIPLQDLLEHRLIVPLRLGGHVVVFQCLSSPATIRRGEWIAFRISMDQDYFTGGGGHGVVRIKDGICMAPVLGVQGDHVEFTPQSFLVNGVAQPRQANMPGSGKLTVPENCWFAWPDLVTQRMGNVPEANITGLTLRVATVDRDQFIGKALQHWFGRRQLFS
jgi:hypothetical protein